MRKNQGFSEFIQEGYEVYKARCLKNVCQKNGFVNNLVEKKRARKLPLLPATLILSSVLLLCAQQLNAAPGFGRSGFDRSGNNAARNGDLTSKTRLNSRSNNTAVAAKINNGISLDQVNGTRSFQVGALRSESKRSRVYPLPNLESVDLSYGSLSDGSVGRVRLSEVPDFSTVFSKQVAAIGNDHDFVFFTIDPELQSFTKKLVDLAKAPHLAVVVMDPKNGRVLAMADKSVSIKNAALHTGFPAASLFKVVTTASALEKTDLMPLSKINFRGGNYTLNKGNYNPDQKRDSRSMSIAEALGKSCNPVFARIALKELNPLIIGKYASAFGFNKNLGFDLPLKSSYAHIPSDSDYDIARTAAGFGDVHMSPIHAAAFMSAVANNGLLPRPMLIQSVVDSDGKIKYKGRPEFLQRVIAPSTAQTLLRMMEYTTTVGTSRSEFMRKNKPVIPGLRVAGKTGTLSGKSPKGLTRWFIGAAPLNNPKYAVAVLAVNPADSAARPSRIGRMIFEKLFKK